MFSKKKNKKTSQNEIRTDICATYIRIYPTQEQQDYIYKTGGSCRFIYNNLLGFHEEKQKQYLIENPDTASGFTLLIPYSEYGKKLTELKKEEDKTFLSESHSKILQQSMRDLTTAFSNHVKFPETFGYPVYKSKKSHRYSFRVPVDAIPGSRTTDGIDCVNGNRISICSELKNIEFDCSRRDMSRLNKKQKEIRSITVVATPDGKFYSAVLMTSPDINPETSELITAIDLGLKDFIIAHTEKILKDDDEFVALTGECISHEKYVKLENFKEPGQKEKAYERAGESRLKHIEKKIKHKNKILSRKEYDKTNHNTLRNRNQSKEKLAYLESKRPERYASYLEKRAKTKPFKHKKKNKVKKQNIQQPVHAKPWHKSSVTYENARKSFAKANAKLANVRNNYQQKTTTEIVRKSAMVATEDLKVANMMKNHKLAHAIQGAGWGAAVQMFAWKCARYGRIYQKIDTFEPSSKVCHVCGYRFDDLTLDVRNMECPVCHTELDRDENASDNICTSSVRDYNAELYEKLYGEPFDDGSQKEQRSETSINNELPLSSGSRDVEMTAAGSSGAGETSALLI